MSKHPGSRITLSDTSTFVNEGLLPRTNSSIILSTNIFKFFKIFVLEVKHVRMAELLCLNVK